MQIPDTWLTERLRVLWTCTEGGEPWEDWYARQCEGGSVNGRALAAVLFDRARRYWPDYFSPADGPAVAVWGDLIDSTIPLATPTVIEQAADDVAALGLPPSGPFYFIRAAERIMGAAA